MSEKVLSYGKYFTRDHPHEIINPRVMRFEEIRWWLKELSTNPEWGWYPQGGAALARSLGMSHGLSSIKRILTTGWIWPKMQVRLTARINDIREGYIVPTRFKGGKVEGVYHEPPIPPVVKEPTKTLRLNVGIGGFSFLPTTHAAPPKMPDFKRAFAEAIYWNPDEKKAR